MSKTIRVNPPKVRLPRGEMLPPGMTITSAKRAASRNACRDISGWASEWGDELEEMGVRF